jgi:hypothetical protein
MSPSIRAEADEEPSIEMKRIFELEQQVREQKAVIRALETSMKVAGKVLLPYVRKTGER